MLATTVWALLVAQSLAKDLVPHVHQQILSENEDNSGRLAFFDAKRVPNRHYKINFIYEQRKTNEITEIERIEEEIGKYMHHQHPLTTTTTTEAQKIIDDVNQKDKKETTTHRPSELPTIEQEKHHHKHEEKKVAEIEQIEEEIRKYIQHHHHPSTTKSTTEAQQNIEVVNEKDTEETITHRPSESPIIGHEKHHHKHEEKQVTEIEQIEDKIRKYLQHHHPSTTKSTTESQQNIEVVNQRDLTETTTHNPSESPIIEQDNHNHKHEEKQLKEIKQIQAEIVKYMNYYYPSTTRSTTEALQNIEVENQKDVKVTTTHRSSESPIIEQEKHHHKQEEKPVTEIEQIEDEVVKYMHHHHPSTTNSTTEAQQSIEVVNQRDIKETTTHRPSESTIIAQENHHHKHDEKEVTEIEQIEEEIVKYIHYYHPSTMTTTTEAQYDIEVLNKKDIKDSSNANTSETPITDPEKHDKKEAMSTLPPPPKLREPSKRRRIPHRHPDHRIHITRTTSEAPVEEEARTDLSTSVTPPDFITTSNIAGSQLDRQDLRDHKLKQFSLGHPNNRLHISHPALETSVEEETQTELSPPVTQSLSDKIRETTNYDGTGIKMNRQDVSAFEPIPKPYRHPNHRLHISRTTSEAPVEVEAQPDLFPSVKQLHEMGVAPNKDVAESHFNPSDSLLYEPKAVFNRHPVNWLHTSRITSAAPTEEEARTDLSPGVTHSDEKTTYEVEGSHLDQSNSSHEPKAIPHGHPGLRLRISSKTSEDSVEEEVRTVTSPPATETDETKEMSYIVAGSYIDRPDSSSHHSDHRLHFSRIMSEEASVDEETRTVLNPPVTQPDEMGDSMDLENDGAGSSEHRDFLTYEPRFISREHPDYRLHVSRKTSESPIEVKARTNNASTDKHLSQSLHNPSSRHKDPHSFSNIRPRLNDMHRAIGLAPRPVYRGSYKFSLDDIYDMHSSTAPKVSQLKENPTPPPVPTLSPWYDGYGK